MYDDDRLPVNREPELMTMGQLVQIQPPDWLVRDLLRQKTICLLSAEPFSGKTMVAMHLMLCLEFGIPFLGQWPIAKNANSLLFCLDPPRWDLAVQLRKLMRGMGLTYEQIGLMQSRVFRDRAIRIHNPKHREKIIAWAKDQDFEAELIIFDTLLHTHYLDENDNSLMGQVMDWIKELRDATGAMILMTHHTPQNPIERTFLARGAGVIVGASDYVIDLTKQRGSLKLGFKKGRGYNGPKDISLRFVDVPGHREGAIKVETGFMDFTEAVFRMLPAPRAQLIAKLQTANIFSEVPESKRTRLLDNILQELRRAGRAASVFGTWQPIGDSTSAEQKFQLVQGEGQGAQKGASGDGPEARHAA